MSNLPVYTVDKIVPAYCGRLKATGNKFKLLRATKDHAVNCYFVSESGLMTDGLRPIIGTELTMSVPINCHTTADHQIAIYALRVVVLGIINNISTIRQQGHREFVINLHPRCSAMVGHNEYFAIANYVVNVDKCYIEVFENGTLPCELDDDSIYRQIAKNTLAASKGAPRFYRETIGPNPTLRLNLSKLPLARFNKLIEDSINSDKMKARPPRPKSADQSNVLIAINSINNLSRALEEMTTVGDYISDEEVAVLSARINFVITMLDDSIRAFNHSSAKLKKDK